MRYLPLAGLALAAWVLALGAASGQGACSHETLTVRGAPVAVTYCPGPARSMPGSEVAVPVSATFSAASGSTQDVQTLRFVARDGPSRVITNLDLTRIGMSGILHLTLVYASQQVHVESAMLTPGAIIVK